MGDRQYDGGSNARGGIWGSVHLPDGTVREMRREGDWILVRREDGSEGRVKADRFEEWLDQQGANAPSVEEIAAFMLRARRRLMWQVMGLLGILAAIGLGMIIMMLIYS